MFMFIKEYLLDTNIVINIWNKYPKLFDSMESAKEIDFKISQDISIELSKKEFAKHNGIPVLTDKFLKLLNHIIDNEESEFENCKFNYPIKHNINKSIYYIDENKLSRTDFNLLCICKSHENYILVTEDKKILSSAKIILPPSKTLNFNEFIQDLENLHIL